MKDEREHKKNPRVIYVPTFFFFPFHISAFIFLLSPFGATAATHSVLILQHRFEPDTARIQPGDTVRWLHQDAAAHTVTGTGTELWESGDMMFGDVYSRVFGNSGEFDYVCLYHPMLGKVIAGDPVAVRSSAGSVEDRPHANDVLRDVLGRRMDGPD